MYIITEHRTTNAYNDAYAHDTIFETFDDAYNYLCEFMGDLYSEMTPDGIMYYNEVKTDGGLFVGFVVCCYDCYALYTITRVKETNGALYND